MKICGLYTAIYFITKENMDKKVLETAREHILHDLKKIAIAINELVRDLDRLENENKNDEK